MEDAGQRRHSLWKGMVQQGLCSFIRERPEAFKRRSRRGIPAEFRAEAWQAALDVRSHAKPGLYQELLTVDNPWIHPIEIDIPRTFPEMPYFDDEQQQSLLRILKAYANLCPDVGYCQGMNFVAGLLLLVAQKGDFRETPRLEKEEETFWMFACLMGDGETRASAGKLSGFYRRRFPLLRRYLSAYDELISEILPELHRHFAQENVQHAVYLHQWFLTLFINSLPLPMVLSVWDVLVCCGLEELLPITVSFLSVLQQTLLELRFEDILRFFKAMRCSGEDACDFECIARHVICGSAQIGVRDNIASQIRAPLEFAFEDLQDRSPQSPSPTWKRSSEEPFTESPLRRASDSVPVGDGRGSGLFSDYFRQLNDDVHQGVSSWWEGTKENLRYVGLGMTLQDEG
eukprot:TRINITY_DN79491_c0_g1_i1.p1 TRINITY_DN79491_c0_g1~~TRINITY_DN79491_c0_g1_i1.p1  ORF type:complete len:401 (-),score=75.09 TRINITY_DN79491_c0_g1_i1:109-1311(-)